MKRSTTMCIKHFRVLVELYAQAHNPAVVLELDDRAEVIEPDRAALTIYRARVQIDCANCIDEGLSWMK